MTKNTTLSRLTLSTPTMKTVNNTLVLFFSNFEKHRNRPIIYYSQNNFQNNDHDEVSTKKQRQDMCSRLFKFEIK